MTKLIKLIIGFSSEDCYKEMGYYTSLYPYKGETFAGYTRFAGETYVKKYKSVKTTENAIKKIMKVAVNVLTASVVDWDDLRPGEKLSFEEYAYKK